MVGPSGREPLAIPHEAIESASYAAQAAQLDPDGTWLDDHIWAFTYTILCVPLDFPRIPHTETYVAHFYKDPKVRIYYAFDGLRLTWLGIERFEEDDQEDAASGTEVT